MLLQKGAIILVQVDSGQQFRSPGQGPQQSLFTPPALYIGVMAAEEHLGCAFPPKGAGLGVMGTFQQAVQARRVAVLRCAQFVA